MVCMRVQMQMESLPMLMDQLGSATAWGNMAESVEVHQCFDLSKGRRRIAPGCYKAHL